jgi:hypothetical protein
VASAQDTPPLPLDRYAHLHAAIDAGELQDQVLEREKVEPAIYLAAQAFWLKRMADEAERRQFETTIRYQTLFSVRKKLILGKLARERAARERPPVAGPPVEALAPMRGALQAPLTSHLGPTTAPAPPAPPPPPLARPAPMASVARVDPRSARDEPARPTPAAPPHAMPSFLAGPQPGAGGPGLVAPPPFAPSPSPPPIVPAPVAQPPRLEPEPAPRRAYATMSIDLAELQAAAAKAATPFKRGDGAPPPAAPVEPQPRAPEGASRPGQTLPGTETPAGSLPFRDEPSQGDVHASRAGADEPHVGGTAPLADDLVEEARRRAKEAARIQAPPKIQLGATGTIDPEVMRQARASLPFGEGAAREAQRRGSSPAIPAAEPPARESPKTQAFDFNSIPAHLREALPFHPGQGTQKPFPEVSPKGAAPPSPSPATVGPAHRKKRFTINVFASLTAEIAESPGDVDAIRQRYGVTESEHHEEARAWTEEFNAHDDLRQRYFGIVQRYRGYIQQRKR